MELLKILEKEFSIAQQYVKNIVELIDQDCTIPFIARYRKELTGSCDDQVLRNFSERLIYLRNLEEKKTQVLSTIASQEKLTPELEMEIQKVETLSKLEDLYRPYRPKRRTRATMAMEKGLTPLADVIMTQQEKELNLSLYIDPEKGVNTEEEGVNGALDIIAERIADDAKCRQIVRDLLWREGLLTSTAITKEETVYKDYYDFTQVIHQLPNHRVLALNRGEKQGVLKVSLTLDAPLALMALEHHLIIKNSTQEKLMCRCIEDSYQRLLYSSVEREIRGNLTDTATTDAIGNFGLNLKPLLLQPPVKGVVGMGIDPAFRTGCKVAVVDETGKLLEHRVIYPTMPHNKTAEAAKILTQLIHTHQVSAIAIGNGTASRETESFVVSMLKEQGLKVPYMIVNESGASVYSASKLAAKEFPDLDVSIRSAISIIRRLQDPLAELVKIEPKAIGVGQYQHDMPPAQLETTLGGVVEDCVNSVGVDVNTASPALLGYVSGLNATTANNIVAYRDEQGAFTSRSELKKVPRLGPKAFVQCAGFLRVPEGKNPLDNTAVHPESYSCAKILLDHFGLTPKDLQKGQVGNLTALAESYGLKALAEKCGVGVPTLQDILTELQKPGRDPRDELPPPLLRTDVLEIKDLAPGMELKGTVRNVINFGAFVDIGVHQDGLVHISQMTNRFIKHPSEVVAVGDVVTVWVISYDTKTKRIALTMKKPAEGK